MKARLGLSRRAEKDWAGLDELTRGRVMRTLDAFASDPRPANIDERPLVGLAPWRRLRVGDLRVIFRSLTATELSPFPETKGYLIERVIPRGELGRATKSLR